MHLTVIGTFGFGDPAPAQTLRAWADRAGVQAVQAYRNPANAPSIEFMLESVRAAGLTFDSLHGIFGPQFDPSSLDEQIRRFTVQTYRAEGELVRRLGGRMVVVHPSPAAESYAPPLSADDLAGRWRQLARSLDELADVGRDLGVEFLIENQPPGRPVGSKTAELAEVVRRAGRPEIGFCFDTGHSHLAGESPSVLRCVGPVLRLVHASDNGGNLDSHLVCFRGTVNWQGVGEELRKLAFDGPFMLEVFLQADQVRAEITEDWSQRLRRTLTLNSKPADRQLDAAT